MSAEPQKPLDSNWYLPCLSSFANEKNWRGVLRRLRFVRKLARDTRLKLSHIEPKATREFVFIGPSLTTRGGGSGYLFLL